MPGDNKYSCNTASLFYARSTILPLHTSISIFQMFQVVESSRVFIYQSLFALKKAAHSVIEQI